MSRKQRRFLGDLDSSTDKHFEEHFVESSVLKRIRTNESDIIYGTKGVGKTALRRALTELHKKEYYATKTIDLDQISFSEVHVALSKLNETTHTETTTLARNTWRNVLAIYCLEAVAEQLPYSDQLKNDIDKLITQEGFKGINSNEILISQIERFLDRIIEFGLEDNAPTPLGLNRKQRSVVNNFPFNPTISSLLQKCANLVESSGKCVLICVDGFDSIVDHTPESRKAIFAGLIDAIHKCSKDALLEKSFCFKAFLPQELAGDADSILWDNDKFALHTHHLRWSIEDIQNLIIRRLRPYAKTKSSQFLDVWHDFMPTTVRNSIHGIDERTFDYILRHTLYRPRQILTHLQRILDAWDETTDTFKIDPKFIPRIVSDTNTQLARSVVNQLEITRPDFRKFMQSWNGANNTMLVANFQDQIKRIFDFQNIQQVNILFDDMFNFGIFGFGQSGRVSRGAQSANFDFAFVGDPFARSIHKLVKQNDLVALSPMFHDYCGCNSSEYGAVIPI